MANLNKIAITTGDRNGIGFEIAVKALCQLRRRPRNTVFFLFRHRSQEISQKKLFLLLDRSWQRKTFFSLSEALAFLDNSNGPYEKNSSLPSHLLIDLSLTSSEAHWVLEASKACLTKKLTSLVTGPLSKKLTIQLPGQPVGHTGIFRHLLPKKPLFMGFAGSFFNVLLATDHIPLRSVEKTLTPALMADAFTAALNFKKLLGLKKPVAVLGLNPHAGEAGALGAFEQLRGWPPNMVGPLVPDAAFLKKNWRKHSVFVALYHDQGLIPFKMQHGQESGVHITLGLPFIRTSVDHGTAYDLFNKGLANPASMQEAIRLNLKLLGVRNV